AHAKEIRVVLDQAIGHGGLQVRRRGEGDVLVRLAQYLQDLRRGADEADLPAGEREDLAGRADLDAALAQAGQADQRLVLQPVKQHMLPDLVADRDGVELLQIAAEQLEILAREDRRGRIERVVEDHSPGLVREDGLERVLVDAPVRRTQGDEFGYA